MEKVLQLDGRRCAFESQESLVYIGANIYYWGKAEQRRLLLEGMRQWALDACLQGLADRFWYCPFDKRGPHLFVLFGTRSKAQDGTHDFLLGRISRYLAESPSRTIISLEEIQRRDSECRGKTLCAPDRIPGFATNNSFVLFLHAARDYPMSLSSGMAAEDDFWRRISDLTLWLLGELEHGNGKAAIRWLVAVSRSIERCGIEAADYWRFHVKCLLPKLRIDDAARRDIQETLSHTIGKHNDQVFSATWTEASTSEANVFDSDRLVQIALADDGRSLQQRFQLLRNVNHVALSQLGHTVHLHLPMVLFAWQRSLVQHS